MYSSSTMDFVQSTTYKRMMSMEQILKVSKELDQNFDGKMFALRNTLTNQRMIFDYTQIWKIVHCAGRFVLMFLDNSWLQISKTIDEDWVYSPGTASEGLEFSFRPYDTDNSTFIHLLCYRSDEFMWIKEKDMWLRIPYASK